MKQFFKKTLEAFKTIVKNKATKHQKWITYGSLCLALLLNIVLSGLASMLLTCLIAFFAEFTYCFVPNKTVVYGKYQFNVPDYKKFRENAEMYLMHPKHNFEIDSVYYLSVFIVIFVILNILFLIF